MFPDLPDRIQIYVAVIVFLEISLVLDQVWLVLLCDGSLFVTGSLHYELRSSYLYGNLPHLLGNCGGILKNLRHF